MTISFLPPIALSQQNSSNAAKVDRLRLVDYSGDMTTLLKELAKTYDVTIGFETVPQQPRPRVTFQIHDATRNQVFDAIVQAVPQYQWREREGVIEFFPVARGSFLDTTIGSLKVTDANWAQATESLLSLPDVREGMRAFGLSRYSVKQEAPPGKQITMELTMA